MSLFLSITMMATQVLVQDARPCSGWPQSTRYCHVRHVNLNLQVDKLVGKIPLSQCCSFTRGVMVKVQCGLYQNPSAHH